MLRVLRQFRRKRRARNQVVNVPLYYLSQSLGKMAECDAVYLCDGWENARGCKVERAAAVAYDLELIGYDLPCRGDAS